MSDSHYAKFTSFRPRNTDPNNAMYCPERDFAQVQLWLAKLQQMIRSGEAAFWVQTLYDIQPADATELGSRLGQAYLRIVEFMEDAAGCDIIGDRYESKAAEESSKPFTYSFEESLTRLLGNEELEPPLLVLLAMLGVVGLNGLFFTIRQDRMLGRKGSMTFDEMWPITLRTAMGVIKGEDEDETVRDALRSAVDFATANGYKATSITAIVDQHLANK